MRAKRRLIAMTIVVFALFTSACLGFQIRLFALAGDKALAPGEVAKVKIDLYRMGEDFDGVGYVGMAFLYEGLVLERISKFDLDRNFGGRFPVVLDEDLLVAIEDEGCFPSATEGAVLYRTIDPVDSSAAGFADRFRVKAWFTRADGTDSGTTAPLVAISVFWVDDGDMLPEDGEVYCTSNVFTGIPFEEGP